MVVADQFLMGSTNVEMENEKDSAKEEAVVKEIGGHRKKKERENERMIEMESTAVTKAIDYARGIDRDLCQDGGESDIKIGSIRCFLYPPLFQLNRFSFFFLILLYSDHFFDLKSLKG
jgi:hypothetical protein